MALYHKPDFDQSHQSDCYDDDDDNNNVKQAERNVCIIQNRIHRRRRPSLVQRSPKKLFACSAPATKTAHLFLDASDNHFAPIDILHCSPEAHQRRMKSFLAPTSSNCTSHSHSVDIQSSLPLRPRSATRHIQRKNSGLGRFDAPVLGNAHSSDGDISEASSDCYPRYRMSTPQFQRKRSHMHHHLSHSYSSSYVPTSLQHSPYFSSELSGQQIQNQFERISIDNSQFSMHQNGLELSSMPTVAILLSDPLAYLDEARNLQPCVRLCLEVEREVLYSSFEEAARAVALKIEWATSDRLQSMVMKGCRVVHFSGHGIVHEGTAALAFEDGCGGAHFVHSDQLRDLVAAGAAIAADNAPSLVVLNCCHSQIIGNAFIEAGVSNVVCIEADQQLMDTQAPVFTRAFYSALLHGSSVQAAFQLGRQAVRASPHCAPSEADKFLLLSVSNESSAHIIFPSLPSLPWCRPCDFLSANFHQIPPVPENFYGRNIEMYLGVSSLLTRRFVTLVGAPLSGRTALALAIANYCSDRQLFRGGIFYFALSDARSAFEVIDILCSGLNTSSVGLMPLLSSLQRKQLLLVFDQPDVMNADIRALFSKLLDTSRDLKVLLTAVAPISVFGAMFNCGEKVITLMPLTPADSIRLLLKRAPRLVQPQEIGVSSMKELHDTLLKLWASPYSGLPLVPGEVCQAATELASMDLRLWLSLRLHDKAMVPSSHDHLLANDHEQQLVSSH